MDICSPGGIVGVSGTYSGNQLGVYAANACVSMALEDGFYDHIEAFGSKLFSGMEDLMKKHGLPGHVSRPEMQKTIEDMKMQYAPNLDAALKAARCGSSKTLTVIPNGISVIIANQ